MKSTDLRFPQSTETEDFEEARLFTEDLYVCEMDWPSGNRGSHSVVGVATRGGLMHPMKRKSNKFKAIRNLHYHVFTTTGVAVRLDDINNIAIKSSPYLNVG
ncbi:hypothetical protein J6590_081092 [Homalodisca vitripennis]|nr:hypothetical protein J6590_081092 [Homalodisca vitripennis]